MNTYIDQLDIGDHSKFLLSKFMSCFCQVLHLLSIQFRILLISHAISELICHCG